MKDIAHLKIFLGYEENLFILFVLRVEGADLVLLGPAPALWSGPPLV